MNLRPFNPTSENEENESNNDRLKEGQANNPNGNQQEKAHFASNQTTTKESKNRMPINTESTNPSAPIILEHMIQGSVEWHNARRSCITMSHAKDLITKPRKKGGVSLTRQSYLVSVASEIITGVTADTYKSWQMERGNILEPFARDAYRAKTGKEVRTVGMGYLNSDRRIAGSPDGLGDNHGMEIKCQMPKNHLATIVNGFDPKEFHPQMQGCMWVFDRESWDYVSFCPEFPEQPVFVYTVYRDEEMIKEIEESALKGIEEIDSFVTKGRASEPNKEIGAICKEALLTIETLRNDEPEFI